MDDWYNGSIGLNKRLDGAYASNYSAMKSIGFAVVRRSWPVLFVLCLVVWHLVPTPALAAPHACKQCTSARKRYVEDAYRYLCKPPNGVLPGMRARLRQLDAQRGILARLQQQFLDQDCANRMRFSVPCRRLRAQISAYSRRIARLERTLLRLARRVYRDCEFSIRLEKRKKCKVVEAPRYCAKLFTLVNGNGTIAQVIAAAEEAVLRRCLALKFEKDNWRKTCPPTPTATFTPKATATPIPIATPATTASATSTDNSTLISSPTPIGGDSTVLPTTTAVIPPTAAVLPTTTAVATVTPTR